jgi:hypothetical protein
MNAVKGDDNPTGEYPCSREHWPQIMRLAHTPSAAAGQSLRSWHTAL